MTKRRYEKAEQVANAIQNKQVKRNSVMVMKRQAKKREDFAYMQVLEEGIKMFDDMNRDLLQCSYYKKPINILTLSDLINLDKEHPDMFTYYHKVRYSMLMLGEVGNVEEYKGMVVTPDEIRNL